MSGVIPQHFPVRRWLELVDDAVAQLPEFQRDVVWRNDRIVSLLNAILSDRPIGCLLLLEVHPSGEIPFDPRPIEGAKPSSDKPVEYLILDGQQRISALWKALTESNVNTIFLVSHSNLELPEGQVKAERIRKWHRDPKLCWEKGFVPISLLRFEQGTEEHATNVLDWIDDALSDEDGRVDKDELRGLQSWIGKRSEQLRNFEIPHLPMPSTTTPSQAIDTFVQSNTSSLKLKKFDIVTAESLSQKHSNLRESRDRARQEVGGLEKYMDVPTIGDLLLKVACLRSNLSPVESNYRKKAVIDDIGNNLDEIIEGIKWVVELLHMDRIWDSRRLPSVVPFRVLPALHRFVPKESAKRGAVLKTARAYLWRAFLTDRYKSAAATLLKEDFDGLCRVVEHGKRLGSVPIWGRELPSMEEIRAASWPTRSALPKALLAVSLRRGARDLGSGEVLRESNVGDREYHHIFPKAYLEREAPDAESNLAMNCTLIRGRANKEALDKPPQKYLRSLANRAVAGSTVKVTDLKRRLSSHLIAMRSLKLEGRRVDVCYEEFVDNRARRVHRDIQVLAEGSDP